MTTRPAQWHDPDWCDDHADEVLDEIRSGDRQPPVGWLMSPRKEVADLRRRVDELKQQVEDR